MTANYACVTTLAGIKDYIGDAKLVAFDFETSPDEAYRNEEWAALDPAKAHIVGCSFSVKEGTGIYVPIAHLVGTNMDPDIFFDFLRDFLTDTTITKIAHNIAFESCMSYHKEIVIQPPVYDTIVAAQMSLKSHTQYRKLWDSGLKKLAPELCGEELPSFSSVTDGRHFDELDAQDYETVRYGSADSDFALRLYFIFNNWFDRFMPRHRWIVENMESPVAIYLGLMKHNGMPVDIALMHERKEEAEKARADIKEKIEFIIGDIAIGENASTAVLKNHLFKKLKLPVLKITDKGQPALDDSTLILLKE